MVTPHLFCILFDSNPSVHGTDQVRNEKLIPRVDGTPNDRNIGVVYPNKPTATANLSFWHPIIPTEPTVPYMLAHVPHTYMRQGNNRLSNSSRPWFKIPWMRKLARDMCIQVVPDSFLFLVPAFSYRSSTWTSVRRQYTSLTRLVQPKSCPENLYSSTCTIRYCMYRTAHTSNGTGTFL